MKYLLLVLTLLMTSCFDDNESRNIIQWKYPTSKVFPLMAPGGGNNSTFIAYDSSTIRIIGCHNMFTNGITDSSVYYR